MEWDGSTLSISGDLDASGGTITGAGLEGGTIHVPNASSPLFEVSSSGNLTHKC